MIEVTRDNFEDVFPSIEYAIRTADFIAIDSEFSGLHFHDDDKPSLFDSGSDRYSKLRRSIQKFTLFQIGLSTFCGDVNTNRYQTQTFQFYLFPRSFASHDQRLSLQASSIQFLRKHKFDFNKWLHDGISYLNCVDEKKVKDLVEVGVLNRDLDRQMDEKEIQSLCSHVAAWIPTSQPGDILTLPTDKNFADSLYVFHKDLRAQFPQIWTSTNAFDQVVVKRVTPTERRMSQKRDLDGDDRYQQQLLNEMLGFSRVFRLLLSARKPIVGHNMLMDLMFMFDKFHMPLPEKYETFKLCIREVFPVIFDTKHIHLCIKKKLELLGIVHARSLEELHNILASERVMNMSLLQPTILRQNEVSADGDEFHNAGYDSFVCGSVFLRLCHFLHSKNFSSMDIMPFAFNSYLPTMNTFRNCVNVIRASVTHTKLDGADPASLRPPFLYVKLKSGFPLFLESMLAQKLSPYGTVDIQFLSSTEALVATMNYMSARDIIYAFKQDPVIEVTNYRYWQHSPLAQKLWWGGFFSVAAASCAVILNLLQRSS